MAISPKTFFRYLAENSDLVVELHGRPEFSLGELDACIERLRSENQPSAEFLRQQAQALGVIEPSAFTAGYFELGSALSVFMDSLLQRQKRAGARILQGFIEEIEARRNELERNLTTRDAVAARVTISELEAAIERVRALSLANRESVLNEAHGLRSQTRVPPSVRFAIVGRLWEVHLEPLRQIISTHGLMEACLDRLVVTLDRAEHVFAFDSGLSKIVSTAGARSVRMRRSVAEHHHAAMIEVAPLYNQLRRDSNWLKGASMALGLLRTNGRRALELERRLALTGWRLSSLLSDASLRALFHRLRGYQPPSVRFLPKAIPWPNVLIIPESELRAEIQAALPLEDALDFILSQWPKHPLASQLQAYAQLLSGALFRNLAATAQSAKVYAVARGRIEAWSFRVSTASEE